MFTYESLDKVADSYIPLLLVISFFYLIRLMIAKNWRKLILQTFSLIFYLGVAYAGMFIDLNFGIWARLGLDYSTHTALSLSIVMWLNYRVPRFVILWNMTLVAYFLLMLYQKYHSFADIITTSLPIGISLLYMRRLGADLWKN